MNQLSSKKGGSFSIQLLEQGCDFVSKKEKPKFNSSD